MSFEKLEVLSQHITAEMQFEFGMPNGASPEVTLERLISIDPNASDGLRRFGTLRHPVGLPNGYVAGLAYGYLVDAIMLEEIPSATVIGMDLRNFGAVNEEDGERSADRLLRLLGIGFTNTARTEIKPANKTQSHMLREGPVKLPDIGVFNPRGDDYRLLTTCPAALLPKMIARLMAGAFSNESQDMNGHPIDMKHLIQSILTRLPEKSGKGYGRLIGGKVKAYKVNDERVSGMVDSGLKPAEVIDLKTNPKHYPGYVYEIEFVGSDAQRMHVPVGTTGPARFGGRFRHSFSSYDGYPGYAEPFDDRVDADDFAEKYFRARNS